MGRRWEPGLDSILRAMEKDFGEGVAALMCICKKKKNHPGSWRKDCRGAEREQGKQFGDHRRMVRAWAMVVALEMESREWLWHIFWRLI